MKVLHGARILSTSQGKQLISQDRLIFVEGRTVPRGFCRNKIRNQKYYLITFIPHVLINQFKFFFNLFFLIIALTQFIPPL